MRAANPFASCVTEEDVLLMLAAQGSQAPRSWAIFAKERLQDFPEVDERPRAALIEVIEPGTAGAGGPAKPNVVRVNGVPVLVPGDGPFIEIEGLDDPLLMDCLIVKLRLFARQVIIGEPLQ